MQETRHKDYPLPPQALQDHAARESITKNVPYEGPGITNLSSPEALSVEALSLRAMELEKELEVVREAKEHALADQATLAEIQRAALRVVMPDLVYSPHQIFAGDGGQTYFLPGTAWTGWAILKDGGSLLTKELAERYAHGTQRVSTGALVDVRAILIAAGLQPS